jgi:hypothetical protein
MAFKRRVSSLFSLFELRNIHIIDISKTDLSVISRIVLTANINRVLFTFWHENETLESKIWMASFLPNEQSFIIALPCSNKDRHR